MSLGVSQVTIKTSTGTTTTNYNVSALTSNPGSVINPSVGGQYMAPTNPATVSPAALAAQRPAREYGCVRSADVPVAVYHGHHGSYHGPNRVQAGHAGDWQYGGTSPNAVFGTWKSFTETIDQTTSPASVSLTGGNDPAQNGWNLGTGADPVPSGVGTSEGYGAGTVEPEHSSVEGLILPGHDYRFYVILHDGDQNKTGGDSGQACFDYYSPAPVTSPSTVSGSVYNDANNSGVKNSGEAGAIPALPSACWTRTDSRCRPRPRFPNGNYSFTGLAHWADLPACRDTARGLPRRNRRALGSGLVNDSVTNDIFTVTAPSAGNATGTGYNFGEILATSSATGSVTTAFNNKATIAPGNTLWLSSYVKVSGLTTTGQGNVTLLLENSSINLNSKASNYTISAPSAEIIFSNSVTDATASTTFNAATDMWVTTVGKTTAGRYFLDAIPFTVPDNTINGNGPGGTDLYLDRHVPD